MKRFLLFIFAVTLSVKIVAQPDTVLTLSRAKSDLLRKNLFLLASHYNISQAEAQLVQAKVWSNPNINWFQEAYNIEQEKYFRATNQFETQITQTISIAGKHTNTVKLAKINVDLSKAQFEDAIRSLLFELTNTYNNLAAVDQKTKLYGEVLNNYEKLQAASKKELQVGSISVTEDLRIKSEYISVKADAVANANLREELLGRLKTLLQYRKYTLFRTEQRLPVFNGVFLEDTLVKQTLRTRADLKFAYLYQQYQERNLKLQKSISLPDLTIGFDYDKGGNYTRDYSGLMIQLPLPIFDRNQGRIQESQFKVKQADLQYQYLQRMAVQQTASAFRQYKKNYEALSDYSPEYLDKLKSLNENTQLFFQKRNISLLEFIDYQRVYINTQLQLIELRQQYLNSIHQLNFSIGTQLID